MGTIFCARWMCSSVTLESTDVADLALLLEPRQGFHGGIERDGRIGDVELVNVDALEAQALQAAFEGLLNVRRDSVVLPDAGTVAHPADLGGDHEARWIRAEGLGDQILRSLGTVRVGRVNEVDAQFHGAAQRGECAGNVGRKAPDSLAGDAHGAVAQAVHRQVAADGDGSGLRRGQLVGCGLHRNSPEFLHRHFPALFIAPGPVLHGFGIPDDVRCLWIDVQPPIDEPGDV